MERCRRVAVLSRENPGELFVDSSRSRVGITDSTGAFAIRRLAAGHYLMHIRRMGYEPIQGFLTVDSGTVQANFAMEITSQRLAKVTVRESAVDVVTQRLERNGFVDRHRSGLSGTFVDQKEILRRQPQNAADILAAYGIHDGEVQLDRMPVDFALLYDYPNLLSRGGASAASRPMVLIWTYIP